VLEQTEALAVVLKHREFS